VRFDEESGCTLERESINAGGNSHAAFLVDNHETAAVAYGRSAKDAALNGQIIPAKKLAELVRK
jgi:hypothetical protein